MNIMIDDDLVYRPTPDGFIRFTTVTDALSYLERRQKPQALDSVLLDNDLGEYTPEGHTFLEALTERLSGITIKRLNIHSQNAVAVHGMLNYLKSADRNGFSIVEHVTTYDLATYVQLRERIGKLNECI